MERGKHNDKPITLNKAQLQALESVIVARSELASRLGQMTYGGSRDLYNALGYKLTLNYAEFWAQYKRQEIAKAIIDRPVKATWQGELELIESEDADRTVF